MSIFNLATNLSYNEFSNVWRNIVSLSEIMLLGTPKCVQTLSNNKLAAHKKGGQCHMYKSHPRLSMQRGIIPRNGLKNIHVWSPKLLQVVRSNNKIAQRHVKLSYGTDLSFIILLLVGWEGSRS